MKDIIICTKCGKFVSRNQGAVSNWAVIKNEMICGGCQGLTDYPASIKSYGPDGRKTMEIITKITPQLTAPAGRGEGGRK